MNNCYGRLAGVIGRKLEVRQEELCGEKLYGQIVRVEFLEEDGKDLVIVLQPLRSKSYVSELFEVAEVEVSRVLGVGVVEAETMMKALNICGMFVWCGRVEGVSSIGELEVLMRVKGLI